MKGILAETYKRVFTPPPDVPIWQFADNEVWLQNEDAAEPGPYRSAKTPWTRRLQELARRMFMWTVDYGNPAAPVYVKIRLSEINIQKSTQSGFTEAILNVIRFMAKYAPRNVIYAIDSAEEAKKIARRLLRSLTTLSKDIFTGDADDIKTTEFLLRGMELLFYGSFSSGKFANKQAPVVIADELEEHGVQIADTSTDINLSYRKKTATGGIQFNLSKPKLEGGPINILWKSGNREAFHIACPHCDYLQYFSYHPEEYESPFGERLIQITDPDTGHIVLLPEILPRGKTRKVRTGRIVYSHCRDLLGNLDELRVLRDTYYECGQCKGTIDESDKQRLSLEAAARDDFHLGWLPTAIGTPGVVSQHMSDLHSTDENSSWGQIVIEMHKARRHGRKQLQGVVNNRLGLAWKEELNKTDIADIRANISGRELFLIDIPTDRGYRRDVFDSRAAADSVLTMHRERGNEEIDIIVSYCPPYKKGTIPFIPKGLIIGSDVGGNYARWVLIAVMENLEDAAVIDWGDEIDPEAIAEIMVRNTWPCHSDGKRYRIRQGFIDAKYRTNEVLRVCWGLLKDHRLKLTPCAGIGGAAARGVRVWSYTPVNSYFYKGKGLKKLDYNDREAKNDLYIACLNKKQRRIFFPVDLFDSDGKPTDKQFVEELCAERLIPDRNGLMIWDPHPSTPNHYGDALKDAMRGLRFLTRKHHRDIPDDDSGEAEDGDREPAIE